MGPLALQMVGVLVYPNWFTPHLSISPAFANAGAPQLEGVLLTHWLTALCPLHTEFMKKFGDINRLPGVIKPRSVRTGNINIPIRREISF